jgi:hypothetical protein
MTKLQMIEERFPDPEEYPDPRGMARMLRMSKAELLAEWKRLDHAEAERRRRWENTRCKCGKLNKNCGELMHQIEAIEPFPSPFLDAAVRTRSKATVHDWTHDWTKEKD